MARRGERLGFVGGLLAALLTLVACAAGGVSGENLARSGVAPAADVEASSGPALVDTAGAPLREEHAAVVRAVHAALLANDLPALRGLYAGDDWAGQAGLLAQQPVRRAVLGALSASPDNLGEGYLYPGAGAGDGSDEGYQTAFFLDYDSPRIAVGPLRWRGIAAPALAPVGQGVG